MSLLPRGNLALLVFLSLYLFSVSANTYTWYDCGPPLTKSISYQSVTLYPNFDVTQSLSLNIQAYLLNDIETSTYTFIQVYRNGELYVNSTKVGDLCSFLISNSISCPYVQDTISYTYEIQAYAMPQIPSGDYSIQITSVLDDIEIACLVVSGTVDGIDADSCTYTSQFQVNLNSQFKILNDLDSRHIGDWIQVGPIGAAGDLPYGSVTNLGDTTADVTPGLPISNFVWGLTGTLTNIVNNTEGVPSLQTFEGSFTIYYNNSGSITAEYEGFFTLNDQITDLHEQFTGVFIFTNGYSYFDQLYYPMILGQLGPLYLSQISVGLYVVQSDQTYCTCAVDGCGVCGGDGSSCNLGTSNSKKAFPSSSIAAIIVSIFGFFALIAIVVIVVKRKKIVKPINEDLDLLDPQKPDYGTMAINEIMNEGLEDA